MDKTSFHEISRDLRKFFAGNLVSGNGGPDILDGIENFFDKIVDMHTTHDYIAS
jgi:hypothetical protein